MDLIGRKAIERAPRSSFNVETNEKLKLKNEDEEMNQDQQIVENLNDNEENKVEEVSGDDIFYDIPETIDYEVEYEKFKNFLNKQINDSFGISVDNLNLNLDKFKKLFHSYGGYEKLEKNLQIKFQPNIIVNENVQLVTPGLKNKMQFRQRKNARNSNENLVGYTDQIIRVIPNQLEIETKPEL